MPTIEIHMWPGHRGDVGDVRHVVGGAHTFFPLLLPAPEAFTERCSTPHVRFALLSFSLHIHFALLRFHHATGKAGEPSFTGKIGLFPRGKETKRPCSCDRLGAIGGIELAEEMGDMMFDRARNNHQGVRNLLVRGAACEQV